MMIRLRHTRAGDTAVLIRVSWSPERQQSVQRVIWTMPADSDGLPAELAGPRSLLSDAERDQVAAWITARGAARRRERLARLAPALCRAAAELAAALESPEPGVVALRSLIAIHLASP